ncbi:MAG: AmmeMemoRadiSam system protein B [Acidobacteriota bacterium]|jgi:Predicted dioxygenase|nr:AmmeMemoRadiSam system protein B [Acidobacteriota bacterium]HOF82191.1 AmmeMemoRadiSam system protein B [Candidatus Aminicenantes bacterium]MDD8029343.1 AmmeMemoRadiSam system protein B [Acidobacteriota bacterium]MDD8033787.1 AmmeMemoRadiSam system protein B [Acidobacteriota bacterium]HOS10677.1 AmmeMemoRadiSam system protein B [Candidatus Aminicenantes bacterium]
MKRAAAVAGSFYPASASELRRMLGSLVDPARKKVKAAAVVCPHAGYVYSGAVAGAVYSSVEMPGTFVILAPAHRPQRPAFAIMSEGSWETPLGSVPVDEELAAAIRAKCPAVVDDPAAHAAEHSLEVQIPFLQYLRKSPAIVPLNVSARADFPRLREAGEAIAAAVRESGKDVLLVASTDMSHYISADRAKLLDGLAIDRILALDARGLVETVFDNDISMCGVLPTAAVVVAAAALGATRAELVAYANSGEVTGDDREVVAYAGLRIY